MACIKIDGMPVKKVCFLVLATLFLFTATAQQKMNNYDKAWKKIDSLIEQKGLPTSALTEVNKLYALAQQEKNDAQLIKALIYRAALRDMKRRMPIRRPLQPWKQRSRKLPGRRKPSCKAKRPACTGCTQQNQWKFYTARPR